ncbi:unnamed protein product, partial [Musa acuminata subsp. burmannicoides]
MLKQEVVLLGANTQDIDLSLGSYNTIQGKDTRIILHFYRLPTPYKQDSHHIVFFPPPACDYHARYVTAA